MNVYDGNIASYNDIILVEMSGFGELKSLYEKVLGYQNPGYLVSKRGGFILATGNVDELKVFCDMHMISILNER